MRKKEFLLELEDRLQRIDLNEKRNIINYYDELISDKVENGQDEERVIRNLGSIEDICRKLDIEIDKRNRIQYESIIEEEISKTEKTAQKEAENKPRNNQAPVKKERNLVLYTLLIILLFPFWFPLLMTCIGLLIGAFAVVFAFTIAGFSLIIAGLFEIAVTIPMFAVDAYGALFNLGASLIVLAIGVMLAPITIKYGGKLAKLLARFIKYIIKKVGGHRS